MSGEGPNAEPPLWHEPKLSVVRRRILSIPGLWLMSTLYFILLPLLLLGAALRDLLVRRDRHLVSVRCLMAFAGNFAMHATGVIVLLVLSLLVAVGGWMGVSAERRGSWKLAVEVWWSTWVYRSATSMFRMTEDIEGDELVDGGPIIFFARHTSIIDTLLPLVLLGGPHRMHLRYVMKRELLWDPCVDIFGHLEPAAFVRRGTSDHGPEIAAVEHLMERLHGDDGVVVFPEGTRYTKAKHERSVRWIEKNHPELAERARRLRHMMPPKLGGPLAVLGRNETADVVFMAHTGLEGANHLSDFFDGSLLDSVVKVRFFRVPRADIPEEHDGRVSWLYDWWERVDEWVEENRAVR